MSEPTQVVVCGGFDDIRSRQLRFLQEDAQQIGVGAPYVVGAVLALLARGAIQPRGSPAS